MDLILHIGTEKTGSTSIQRALANCRDDLRDKGILYPRLFGSENHMEVAVAAMGPRPHDPLQLHELTRRGMDLPTYQARLQEQLAQEIRESGAKTLLISNEHCHGRLDTPMAVQNLAKLLGAPFGRVKVIVYMRRQDRMAVSMHSTRLREGDLGQILPHFKTPPHYYSMYSIMSLYADLFGDAAIIPRLYERERLIGGDVVPDFFATAGFDIEPPAVPQANRSLSRQQARFLTMFNAQFPLIVDGKLNPDRGPVMAAIHHVLPGPQAKPSRAAAEAFQEQFDEVNRRARDRFMPDLDRPSLFDTDFEDYPETGDTERPLTEEELMAFVTAIWRFRSKR